MRTMAERWRLYHGLINIRYERDHVYGPEDDIDKVVASSFFIFYFPDGDLIFTSFLHNSIGYYTLSAINFHVEAFFIIK